MQLSVLSQQWMHILHYELAESKHEEMHEIGLSSLFQQNSFKVKSTPSSITVGF